MTHQTITTDHHGAIEEGTILAIDGKRVITSKVDSATTITVRPLTLRERFRWLFLVRLNLTLEDCIQAILLILSAIAIYLVALPDSDPLRRWGYAIGLASQPLWFWSTWRARQWGMFALAWFYTCVWYAGLMRHFA